MQPDSKMPPASTCFLTPHSHATPNFEIKSSFAVVTAVQGRISRVLNPIYNLMDVCSDMKVSIILMPETYDCRECEDPVLYGLITYSTAFTLIHHAPVSVKGCWRLYSQFIFISHLSLSLPDLLISFRAFHRHEPIVLLFSVFVACTLKL